MKQYNFDQIIDRQGTNSINAEGYQKMLLKGAQIDWAREDIIRMWVADMEFAVPDVILNAMRKRLDRQIFGYTKILDPKYYESFAAWNLKRYDWNFPKEHLVTSPGIVPALYQLPDLMMQADETILIMTPSYGPFKGAADFNQRKVVYSPLIYKDQHWTMDLEDLHQRAKDAKTTLCIFCNPHNPTGRAWSHEELTAFSEIMQKENMWVISDEIHCDLLRSEKQHIPLGRIMGDYPRLVTCMSPSKTFNLAGLLISNLIIPDPTVRKAWMRQNLIGENPLSITAAQAAYTEGEDWLTKLLLYLDENFRITKDFFDEHFPLAHFKIPEATYLAWVDLGAYLPEGVEEIPLYFAQKTGIILEDGSMFVDNADGFVRLNLACPRSVLKDGLERIQRALIS